MHAPVRIVDRSALRGGQIAPGARRVAEETPVALTYNGGTYAVMMATPQDLEDFAVGFSLSEGIVRSPDEILSLEVIELDDGIELRMWLAPATADAHRRTAAPDRRSDRLRHLRHRVRSPRRSGRLRSLPTDVASPQPTSRRRCRGCLPCRTSTSKPAPFMPRRSGRRRAASSRCARMSDATMRLTSSPARSPRDGIAAGDGMVLLTSRVSVEMVQKTAAMGAAVMVAVSAPTALAVRMAETAGITLVAVARADGFEIFTRPERIAAAAGWRDDNASEQNASIRERIHVG